MKAKRHLGWVKQQVEKDEDFLKEFLTRLEAVAPEDFQEEATNGGTDKM